MPLNPFDWTAGPFLTLYVTITALVFFLGFRSRSMIGPAAQTTQQLNILELAYLAGGAHRLGDVMLLSLMSGGATIIAKDDKITVTDQTPLKTLMERPPLLLFQPDMTREGFQMTVEPIVERVQRRLQDLGYYPTHEQMTSFRIAVLTFVGSLLAFGIIKALIGSERDHPVGLLVILLAIIALAGVALATYPPRTRAGKDVLEAYQASNARSSRAPLDHELLFAVALTGPIVLSGTAYAPVYAASQTMSSGSGCGNSGGGDGCGGGGCGGCS